MPPEQAQMSGQEHDDLQEQQPALTTGGAVCGSMTEDELADTALLPDVVHGVEEANLLSYSFSPDGSHFVCGTTCGFRVYSVSPLCEVLRDDLSDDSLCKEIPIVAVYSNGEMLATVTSINKDADTKATMVNVWDCQRGRFVKQVQSKHSDVKGIVFGTEVMAVVYERMIFLYQYNRGTFAQILQVHTCANPMGLCALSVTSVHWILCCPAQSVGRVQISQNESDKQAFRAHDTALAALALTKSGSLLATASEHGTIVKVFRRPDGGLLYRFRRGTHPTLITSLTFDSDERYLAAASSSPTVHIFKLDYAVMVRKSRDPSPPPSPYVGGPLTLGPLTLGPTPVATPPVDRFQQQPLRRER